MSTFAAIVRAALEEYDPHAGRYVDHYRITDPDKLTDLILVHMTAYALARAERDDAYEEMVGWAS